MPVWDGQKYLMDKLGYSTVIFLSQPNWFLAEFNIGRQRFENLSISKSETFQIWEHVCILLPVLVFWCLQMSTSAGWDGIMEPTLYVDSRGAECNPGLNGGKRTCMSTSFIGYFYFIRYLIATTKWSALIFVKKTELQQQRTKPVVLLVLLITFTRHLYAARKDLIIYFA